jgi:hypothetical protein
MHVCQLVWIKSTHHKKWYPLPLILGLFDQLSHAKVYTKITYVEHTTWYAFKKVINGR